MISRARASALFTQTHTHTHRTEISQPKRQATVPGCWFLHNKISLMRFKCQINLNNSVRQFTMEFVCFCRKLPIGICTIFQCSHTLALVRVARGDISLPDIIISNIKQLNSMRISTVFFFTCCIIHNSPCRPSRNGSAPLLCRFPVHFGAVIFPTHLKSLRSITLVFVFIV